MNIISRGQKPDDKIWRGTCHSCKSVIEARQAELHIYNDQRNGSFGEAKCPVCEKNMNFYEKKDNYTQEYYRK